MEFTFNAYYNLIESIRNHGYRITNYENWEEAGRCVILRHDIDNDVGKALEFARFEADRGIKSTYFVLLTSDFYNVFSKNNVKRLREISSLGHETGLHFDETQYPDITGNTGKVLDKIQWEAEMLGNATGLRIRAVSMHRPSQAILDANLEIPGMVNSYGTTFFRKFKYLSDSRHQWREPVGDIIESGEYERLHILTHAFWYHGKEQSVEQSIRTFINSANYREYSYLEDNFTNLSGVMKVADIMGIKPGKGSFGYENEKNTVLA